MPMPQQLKGGDMVAPARLPDDRILIDLTEAARRLSVSPKHLWTLAKQGQVPSVKLGARRLFVVAVLEQAFSDQLMASTIMPSSEGTRASYSDSE
jgi:hypothetical protein